jgi:sulfite exporter TauE/SafE
MEKIKQHLIELQANFDSVESRDLLNQKIIQMAISRKIKVVKKQRIQLGILLHLGLVTAFFVISYILKQIGWQLTIQDINISTFILIIGFYFIFSLLQKVLLFFRFNKA